MILFPSTHIKLDQDNIIKNGGAVTARGNITDLQKRLVNIKSFGASFPGVKYSDIDVIPSSF